MNNELNFNLAHCIKETHDIGETVYYNICKGTAQAIPWGGFDWVGFGIFSSVACLVLIGGFFALYDLWRGIKQ